MLVISICAYVLSEQILSGLGLKIYRKLFCLCLLTSSWEQTLLKYNDSVPKVMAAEVLGVAGESRVVSADPFCVCCVPLGELGCFVPKGEERRIEETYVSV